MFEDAGRNFRATKDLDIVLIVEALSEEFARRFWQFIREGGYKINRRSDGIPRFYRFEKPENREYPAMLELFTRRAVDWIDQEATLEPLPLGEDLSSLSAIILNESYYQMVRQGKDRIGGVTVLGAECLIPLKAKAWQDLSQAKSERHIDKRDINKHKNDIVRLTTLLSVGSRFALPEEVKNDMDRFLAEYIENPVQPRELGLKGVTSDQIVSRLREVYGLGGEG